MSPPNNQDSRVGGTPGLAGTPGGWPRPARPCRKLCVCVQVCVLPTWVWVESERGRKRGRKTKPSIAFLSFFFKKAAFFKWCSWNFQNGIHWTSRVVQWLGLSAPNAGILGLIPGQGARSHVWQLKIPHAASKTRCSQMNK